MAGGEYGKVTLIKGIGYPVLLLLVHVLHIPYSIFVALVITLSAALFCHVAGNIVQNFYVRAIGYVIILWAPYGYSEAVTQRLYRNTFSAPLTLLIISCMIGIHFCMRKRDKRGLLCYSIFGGICLFLFVNLREDSAWMYPFLIVAYLISVLYAWMDRDSVRSFIKLCLCGALIFIVTLCGNGAIRGINNMAYGTTNINDRTDGAFEEFCRTLVMIEPVDGEPEDVYLWVSREKLARVLPYSETLADDVDVFLGSYNAWACGTGVLTGDMYMWAVRDAGELLGHYADAAETEAFWAQATEELQEAIDAGELTVGNKIYLSSSMRGLTVGDLISCIGESLETIERLDRYEVQSVGIMVSSDATDITVDDVGSFLHMSYSLLTDASQATDAQLTDVTILSKILVWYQTLAHAFLIAGMLCFLFVTIRFFYRLIQRKQQDVGAYLVIVGIFVTAYGFAMMIHLFCSWLVAGGNIASIYFYGSSFTPLVMAFELLAIGSVVDVFAIGLNQHR